MQGEAKRLSMEQDGHLPRKVYRYCEMNLRTNNSEFLARFYTNLHPPYPFFHFIFLTVNYENLSKLVSEQSRNMNPLIAKRNVIIHYRLL